VAAGCYCEETRGVTIAAAHFDRRLSAATADDYGEQRMLKNVGIATGGVAIGVPVWGIALAIGGVFVAGTLLGFALAGPAGAIAVGSAALAS